MATPHVYIQCAREEIHNKTKLSPQENTPPNSHFLFLTQVLLGPHLSWSCHPQLHNLQSCSGYNDCHQRTQALEFD